MDIEKFLRIIELVARRYDGCLARTDTQIILQIRNSTFLGEISDIEKIYNNMLEMSKKDVALYNNKIYEIALDRRIDIMRFLDRNDLGVIEDSENQIQYIVNRASLEYLFWFLYSFEENDIRRLRDVVMMNPSVMHKYEKQENASESLLEFLSNIFRNLWTLRIQCSSTKTDTQFEKLFDAFRFQTASNFNDVIMPLNDFRELLMTFGGRRITNSLSDITAPKRIYIEELTNQYYMGISSKLPFVEFISYYHVMEYFFEKVYNDDIIKNLQDKISSPRFSIKREQDIKDIVRFVTKKVHDKNERYDINELEALELVLRKYINIPEILDNVPSELVAYYKTSEVPFSKGDIIDFGDSTNPKLYKKIAARIYKTRNSIIHSKSGEKEVYSPFTDDEALEKEVVLLRYIAEEIIIKTSSLM